MKSRRPNDDRAAVIFIAKVPAKFFPVVGVTDGMSVFRETLDLVESQMGFQRHNPVIVVEGLGRRSDTLTGNNGDRLTIGIKRTNLRLDESDAVLM